MLLSRSYFGLLVGVPGEGNGVIGNLLDVADGVETLLVVSCGKEKNAVSFQNNRQVRHFISVPIAARRSYTTDLIPS